MPIPTLAKMIDFESKYSNKIGLQPRSDAYSRIHCDVFIGNC